MEGRETSVLTATKPMLSRGRSDGGSRKGGCLSWRDPRVIQLNPFLLQRLKEDANVPLPPVLCSPVCPPGSGDVQRMAEVLASCRSSRCPRVGPTKAVPLAHLLAFPLFCCHLLGTSPTPETRRGVPERGGPAESQLCDPPETCPAMLFLGPTCSPCAWCSPAVVVPGGRTHIPAPEPGPHTQAAWDSSPPPYGGHTAVSMS